MRAELLMERDNKNIKHLVLVEENEVVIKPLEKKRVPTLEELGYSFDMGM
jgi:hypothetical protein